MRSDVTPPQLSRRTLLEGCAAALIVASVPRAARAKALTIGVSAPPATLVTLDGERITTSELRSQVVVLTFWATWCEPCREELPLLSRYAAQHAGAGLSVLGFSLDPPERAVQVREIAQTLSFPVGLLAQSSAPGYGRIWRLPVNFTIDRDGRLANDGWQEKVPRWTEERLETVVTPLLAAGERGVAAAARPERG